jgi:hypothetical protein
MNTTNQNSITETPSSQGGVICRFDFISRSLKIYKDVGVLASKLGKTIQHTNTIISETHLVDNRYVFYKLDEILTKKSQPSFRIKLPKRQIQKLIAEEKRKTTKIILDKLKDFVGENFKGVLVYVLNKNGNVIRILEGHKDVSEHFKIPIGTVKSRLYRIRDFETAIKYGMCKKSVFDTILK